MSFTDVWCQCDHGTASLSFGIFVVSVQKKRDEQLDTRELVIVNRVKSYVPYEKFADAYSRIAGGSYYDITWNNGKKNA